MTSYLPNGKEELKGLLNDLNGKGKKDVMKLNKKKTKATHSRIIIGGEELAEVDEYRYTGRLLTSVNEMDQGIDQIFAA